MILMGYLETAIVQLDHMSRVAVDKPSPIIDGLLWWILLAEVAAHSKRGSLAPSQGIYNQWGSACPLSSLNYQPNGGHERPSGRMSTRRASFLNISESSDTIVSSSSQMRLLAVVVLAQLAASPGPGMARLIFLARPPPSFGTGTDEAPARGPALPSSVRVPAEVAAPSKHSPPAFILAFSNLSGSASLRGGSLSGFL